LPSFGRIEISKTSQIDEQYSTLNTARAAERKSNFLSIERSAIGIESRPLTMSTISRSIDDGKNRRSSGMDWKHRRIYPWVHSEQRAAKVNLLW
jgi:hypothetical protein